MIGRGSAVPPFRRGLGMSPPRDGSLLHRETCVGPGLPAMIMQAAQRARSRASSVAVRVLASADHRALFGSMVLIGLITLVVKGVTLGRDILMAARFGTSDASDAFVTAWVVPGFLGAVVTSGFVAAVIPVQIETRVKSGPERERAVIGEVMLLSTLSYLLAVALLLGSIRGVMPLVAQGYTSDKLELAIGLSLVMLPAVVMSGVGALWSAVLNAHEKFGLVAAAPGVIPLVAAVLLLIAPGAGIEWVAAAFVVGTGLQAAVLYLGLARAGLPIALGWHGLLPETRAVLRQTGVIGANAIAFTGLSVVDMAMAATLGPGSQSTLLYANKLIMPVLAISSTAIGTAVLPYFSRLVAAQDWDGMRHTLFTYIRLILAAGIPAAALVILFAGRIVRVLFERGEFTAADTHAVARLLAMYALLIPIQTVAVLLSRVLLSLQIGKAMVVASIGIFIANVILDYVLKELMGVEGIALATVINNVISLVFLTFMWRHLRRTRMRAPA